MVEQIISVLVGLIAVPLIQYIKTELGWEGKPAALLAAGFSLVIALAALFAAGQLKLTDFTLENFTATFGLVFATATLAYKLTLAE